MFMNYGSEAEDISISIIALALKAIILVTKVEK